MQEVERLDDLCSIGFGERSEFVGVVDGDEVVVEES
jgi:hypothetical protein